MAPYRVKLLNPQGTLHEERIIHCAHDDEAIDRVGNMDHPHAIEVWQGERHVARFPPWHGPRLGPGLRPWR